MKFRIKNIIFGAACAAVLFALRSNLLYHMEQFSMFTGSGEQLAAFMEQPGGALQLAGAFLTQFCHFPLVGAVLIALCLCILAALTDEAFKLDRMAWPMAFLPSLFLLLFIMRLDYSVYIMKEYGLLFSQILGLTVSVGIVIIYRKWLTNSKLRTAFIPLMVIVGFPLFGMYAPLGALLIVICEKESRLANLVSAIVISATLPVLCACIPGIYERANLNYIFFAGFPCIEFPGQFLSSVFPIILAIISLPVLAFSSNAGWKISVPTAVTAIAIVAVFSNWDKDLATVLDMERAVCEERWDDIIKEAKKSEETTRAQVLYRNIALFQKGRLTEDMFTYPEVSRDMETGIDIGFICAAPALHFCGMVNSCDRLAMEASASFSKNLFYTKLLARDAIARGENDLAKKYISIVDDCWFQRAWVRKHLAFLSNQENMKKDRTFSSILSLMQQESTKFDVVEPVESMIRRNFSTADYINEDVYEWQMATFLTWKDSKTPVYCMFNRQEMFPNAHITKGIAEAMALFVSMTEDRDMMVSLVNVMSSQRNVLKNFSGFSNDINRTVDMKSKKTEEYFRKHYGRSYWMYYYFNENTES